MRRLLWLTLGFGLGCLVGCFLPQGWNILFWCAFSLTAAAGAAVRWWKPARIPAWLLLGLAFGSLWFGLFDTIRLQPLHRLDGVQSIFTVTVTSEPEKTQYGWVSDGKLTLAGKTRDVRLYLDEDCCPSLGEKLRGEFRLWCTAPGGSRATSFYQGKRVFLLAYQQGDLIASAGENTPMLFAARFAGKLKRILEAAFPEDAAPFAKALLLGDTTDLGYRVDTALKNSGIRHVVSVSGLHVTMIYAVISTLLGKKRVLTALVCLPVMAFFAAMTGFSPSVVRACTMVCLMILAQLFLKEYDAPTALAASCLVMLISNPFVILSAGFQLSVACVVGIQLFSDSIRERICAALRGGRKKNTRWEKWLSSGLAITLSTMSMVVPLSAWYFGTVSLSGLLTNLLTQWLITVLFCGILITGLLGLVWSGGAAVLGWLLAWPIRLVLWVAGTIAALPFSVVYTQSPYITLWLLFVYILLGVLIARKGKDILRTLCYGILGLCLALSISWLEPKLDHCRVTVLDVGQGQCILLQSEGKNWLVDCGGDRADTTANKAAALLLQQGITRLDGVILTHFDADHSNGLDALLSRVDTELLFLPAMVNDFTVPPTEGEVLWVDQELEVSWGTTIIRIYPPFYSGYSNENSLCILFDTEKCDILITGDRSGFGERMLLRNAALPKVDVLIAGHHGASDSAEAELLTAVRPETVLISVGENYYGHPSPALLARLEDFGCTVYRTDLQGTIIYRR